MKRYLRKRQVAQRYGNIAPRSVERAVVDGRIPPPEYPMGPHTPMWDLDVLEANERAATIRGSNAPPWRHRLLFELAAAVTGSAAAEILVRYKAAIEALPEEQREKLLAECQDIIAEKSE
jgi:hypothetical protein